MNDNQDHGQIHLSGFATPERCYRYMYDDIFFATDFFFRVCVRV